MGPFVMFWIIGEGIITFRSVKQYHAPPLPSALLATSGLFVILALFAEWQPKLSMMLAAGFDIAAFVNLISKTNTPCPAAPVNPDQAAANQFFKQQQDLLRQNLTTQVADQNALKKAKKTG